MQALLARPPSRNLNTPRNVTLRSGMLRAAFAVACATAALSTFGANATVWHLNQAFGSYPSLGTPWSVGSRTGAGCTSAGTTLTPTWNQSGTVGYAGSGSPTYIPLVAYNPATSPVSITSVTVPSHAVWMHPGAHGECAVVRFTAPTACKYTISGSMRSIDVSPSGVRGYLFAPGLQSGYPVTLSRPQGSSVALPTTTVSLSAGQAVDFALDANGIYLNDSTQVDLTVESSPACATSPVVVHPLPPSPNNPCKMCFEVGGLPPPGAVGNSAVVLTVQYYQNGAAVGAPVSVLLPGVHNGVNCITPPSPPPGASYDYVVTAATATVNGNPATTQIQAGGTGPNGIIQGPNNDVTGCSVSSSDCCPNFTKKWALDAATSTYFGGMLTAGPVSMDGTTPYSLTFNGASLNATQLVDNFKHWADWLKFNSGCTGLVGFRLTMQPVLSTQTPAGPFGPLPTGGSSPQQSVVIGPPWSGPSPATLTWSLPQSPYYNYMRMTVTPIGANNQPIKCDLGSCLDNMFARWHFGSVAKIAAGNSASGKTIRFD